MDIEKFIEKKRTFVSIMIKMLQVLDAKVFEDTAQVRISNEFCGSGGIVGFSAKRSVFRSMGLSDDYIIFMASPMWKNFIKVDFIELHLSAVAVHEVRHRFQRYNKKSLISLDFAKENLDIDQSLVDFAEKSSKDKSKAVKKKEFDALLIGSLASKHYLKNSKDNDLSFKGMVSLIKCEEDNLLEIIKEYGMS